MNISVNLEASAQRLFPSLNLEQAVAQLLLERAKRNFIKYQTINRQFGEKYRMEFAAFREKILSTQPDSQMEQDYFDWELAVTGITDMEIEIKNLSNISTSK